MNGSLRFLQRGACAFFLVAGLQASPETQKQRQEIFETVWTRINEKYFDPNFNGVDWKAVHERYSPRVSQLKSDEELFGLLNQMLGELHQSHLVVIPENHLLNPDASIVEGKNKETSHQDKDKNATQKSEGDQAITTKTGKKEDGNIGATLNFVEGKACVIEVKPNSPAAKAGLRPGILVTKVGDFTLPTLEELSKEKELSSLERLSAQRRLNAKLGGAVGTKVKLIWSEGASTHETEIERVEETGEKATLGNLTLRTEFETKSLEGGIGYIRFNCFMMNLLPRIQDALKGFLNAPGLVIDLRGNPGGVGAMVCPIGAYLLPEKTNLGTMKMREGELRFPVNPKSKTFSGPVAILVDERSGSTAEVCSGSLQDIGRAFVVGRRSAGAVLPAAMEKLSNGALFLYAIADFKTPHGVALEGRGVIPDFPITLSRQALLDGRDLDLEKAIQEIKTRNQSRKEN